MQQNQDATSISAAAVPQHVAQSYQAPGHQQQLDTAASSLTFPLKVQQTCQNYAAPVPQQAHPASGYPAPVQQQTAALTTTLPSQLPAQSYPLASVAPTMAAIAQCHPAQVPNTQQQVQAPVNLSSQQPGQSSSTPALYNQQTSVKREHQHPLLQNTQSNIQLTQHAGQTYIQPQLHSQEALLSIHQQMAQQPTHHSQNVQSSGQQQIHTPTPQKHSQKNTQTAALQQSTVQQVPVTQPHSTATQAVQAAATHQSYPAAGLPDAGSQSYAHSAPSALQQQTAPAQSQFLPVQSTAPQTYGGAKQVVTPQSLPVSVQQGQAAPINQQVSEQCC